MRLITRNTDYAVRALFYINGQKGKVVSVSELAKELKIPRPFLRKILQALNKEGMLKSYKGSGGGFNLGRPGNKIFLFDLIKALQGPVKFNECIFKNGFCPDIKSCALKKRIGAIEKYVVRQLQSITIASLCAKGCAQGKTC